MHLAYVDESGQPGPGGRYTLAVVVVQSAAWPATLEKVISFRKFLRTRFGIRVGDELKADYLLRDGGPLRRLQLSEPARFAIYRQHMRLQPKIGLRTFAVVIRQPQATQRLGRGDPRVVAWQIMLRELEQFTIKNRTEAVLVHDQGGAYAFRNLARRAYRASGGGLFGRPATLLLDGVLSPRPEDSSFFQLADLNAHAAFRALYPPPSHYRYPIVVPQTWNELGAARLSPLSQPSQGPTGIVVWP